MGAFLSGLLGAAGADIEKQADRQYQEKRQERMDQMKILEMAISNPQLASEHPEQIPMLFGRLQEIADDAKYKSANKSIKDPMVKIGQFAGHLFQRRKQQQQQQGQQQQYRADVQGAPGVTAQPANWPGYPVATPPFIDPEVAAGRGAIKPQQPVAPGPQSVTGVSGQQFRLPQGGQGTPITAAMPPAPVSRETQPMPMSRFGSMPTRGELRARDIAELSEDEERKFRTELRHSGIKSQVELDQKVDAVNQLISNGYDKQTAQQIVFGKSAAPVGPKFAPFYISGAQVPQETQVDALGNPIDRQNGMYKLEETTGKFYPATGAPRAGGNADKLAQMAKIILAKNGITKPTEAQAAAATQEAGVDLFRNIVLNPQERIQLQRDAVRTIVGESGVLVAPSHQPNAQQRGMYQVPFGKPTPPIPPRPGANAAPPVGSPGGGPLDWQPRLRQGEVTAMDTAHGVMESALRAAKELPQLESEHPNWFGTFAGRLTTARMPESGVPFAQGTAPPELAGIQLDAHSVAAFLTGVHRARGIGYANLWAKVLGNPWVNPKFTTEAFKRAAQVAEAVMKEAAKPTRQAMSIDQVIADLQRTNPDIFRALDTPPGGAAGGAAGASGGPPATKLNPYR